MKAFLKFGCAIDSAAAAKRASPIMLDLELGLAHLDRAVVEQAGNFALLGGEGLHLPILEGADRNYRQPRIDLH